MFSLLIPEETSSVELSGCAIKPRVARLMLGVLVSVLLFGTASFGVAAGGEDPKKEELAEAYGKVPLSFEPNRGQTDGSVQFLSRGPGYGIFLTPGEAVLSFNKGKDAGKAAGQSVLGMKLVGANTAAKAEAEEKLPGTANYMRGSDSSKWATKVPTYGKVKYAGVYPGVDLLFYGNQRQLEYDFVVAPGKDAGKIALEFTGATPVVDASGDLVLGADGDAKFHRPVAYQVLGGKRVAVAAGYEVAGQRVKFRLGKYDHSKELVIDPVVTYLTYLGGSTGNNITGIAVDSYGAAYLTGSTQSADFPLKGAYEATFPANATTMFVTKLNQSGTSIVYSTFIASNLDTVGSGIAVDSAGSAYVVGYSDKAGFPVTSGAFQTLCGAAHDTSGNRVDGCTQPAAGITSGVLAKLSADGTSIVYATYLAGNNANSIHAVAVDAAGEAYVAGQTDAYCGTGPYSATASEPFECFPTTNGSAQSATSIPSTGQYSYAFFTKFDAAGATLIYSSILGPDPFGPASKTNGGAVAVDANGIGYITGQTGNTLYTTDGSFQQNDSSGGNPAFVAAFDPSAGQLKYSTYLGGQTGPADVAYGIAADATGNAYVTGETSDCDFPVTTGAYETEAQYAPTDTGNVGKCDTGFVAKLNPNGNALVWATYLGSAPLQTGTSAAMLGLALGSDNSVYVAGSAIGGGYPMVNPVLPQGNTNSVAVVTHLSGDGSTNLFSSTVGGPVTTATEYATALAVDSAGSIYLAGNTNEQYLPTTNNVVQTSFAGTPGGVVKDGFVAKISPAAVPQPSNGLTGNLLANPGAELGSLADWTIGGPDGPPTVDTGVADPGINPHTGTYDFTGNTGASDSLSQTVSVIQQGITAAEVDAGTLFANLSFWQQGLNQAASSDNSSVTLTFLDANNAAISSVTSSVVDSHDGTWANGTGTYPIPAGTRSITYTMNFTREVGVYLDSYVDDNLLFITTNTGLTLFPGRLHFGNVTVGNQSASQTVSVTNQQTTTVNIEQILSELGANPSDFIETDNCPAALIPGASCTLTITFVPDGVGAKSAGVAINTDSVPALQSIAVDGTGTGGILQVNPGNLKTIAGVGTSGYTGDGGAATAAQLKQPNGVAFDPSGNLYVADNQANVVRKVDTAGNITTFAGVGTGGFTGDGGPATQAELSIPFSVTSDKNGNIYIEDTGNDVIRKVDTNGVITTFAGTPQTPGHAGDGGPATAAKFNQNQGARFDSAGNLYVPTCLGSSIRKIDTAGNISTVAGNFTAGFSGDGGQATAAMLQCPSGVTIDPAGNLYIADEFNQVIRKVTAAGVISTIAGTPGVAGFAGDGGAATAAKFTNPNDVVIDSMGNLYVADSGNNRVRKIDVNGVITTAAGGLNNAGSAAVNTPLGVTVDTAGNVYFSDAGNSAVREIFPQGVQPFPATQVGTTSAAQSLTLSNIGNVDVTLAANGALTTSGNAGDFALSPGSCTGGAVLAANGGSCAVSITFTPTAVGQRVLTVTIADNALNTPQSFSIGGTGVAPAGQQQTPVITWAMPAAITTATPLSATQLDATATDANGAAVPGAFVYTPAAGAVLPAGTQTLNVTFTPTDTTAFTTATGSTTIVVTQAAGGTAAASTTTLALTPVNGAQGTTFTLTATVVSGGDPVTGGAVNFLDNGKVVASVQVVSATGVATFKTKSLTIGSHALTAMFTGTSAAAPSSTAAAITLNVTGHYATTTALTATGVQGSYALTGVVSGLGLGSPTGNLIFSDTSTSTTLGTVPFSSVVRGYVAGTPIAAGSAALQVVSADVNGDGKLDLVEANGSGTMVTVLLGKGDGTYTALPAFGTNYNGITGVAVADFNGDGKLDIATANQSTVGIFLGNGDGTFGAEQDFANTNTSAGVFAGDFNGDGKLDLAVPDRFNGMTILIGNGDGTFTQPNPAFAVGASPNYHSAVADFNGDGKLDIAAGNFYDNTVSILIGNGDGTFQAPVTYATGAAPTATFAADLNGDGFQDIFLTNANDGTLSVFLGNGDGTFKAQQTYAVGSNPYDASAGDLDGDGKLDIAVANVNDGTVSILIGNGDGTFQAQQVLASGAGTESVTIGDANGDGSPDIESINAGDNTVSVYLNKATATATLTGVTLPGMTKDGVDATYNGDALFAGSSSNSLELASNLAATTTTLAVTPAAPTVGQEVTFTVQVTGTAPNPIKTGTVTFMNTAVTPAAVLGMTDVGQSGAAIFTTTTLAAGTYTVTAVYSGDGGYAASTSAPTTFTVAPAGGGTATATATTILVTVGEDTVTTVPAGTAVALSATVTAGVAPVAPGQVAFCDATAATCTGTHLLGTVQLITTQAGMGTAILRFVSGIGTHSYKAVFLGTKAAAGSASEAAPLAVTGTYPTATTIAQSGTAGNFTLTATTVGTGNSTVATTGTISFLDTSNANAVLGTSVLGASTAGFALAEATGSPAAVGNGAYGVATGDFNDDGFADVAVENYNQNTVSVLLGNGDGTFQPQVTYAVGAKPERVLTVDLNSDGILDLIVANTGSDTISVLLGNGDGTFQDQVTYAAASPVGLGVMDINHDGIPDVVAGDYYANTMSVLLGNGDGTLKAAVTYPTGSTPQTVAEGDFNGDGNVDVVVGNEGGASIGVFLGNGDGTFQTMVAYSVGSGPQGVQVGDFNGDGKLDLAVSNHDDSDVGVLLGNGDGTFRTQVPYQVGSQPIAIEVGDFNGDGILDITVGSTGNQTQDLLLGNGDGTFQKQMTFPAGNFPYGVAVADFNGDGFPDMAVANFNDATATILLSQATETATATVTGISPAPGTHAVTASYPGDLNYKASVSQPTTLIVPGTTTTVITWIPAVATIPYGTALGASQLNATAATAEGAAIPGTFVYTPVAGTVLGAGMQTLNVAFTPTSASYSAAMGTATITVMQATPVITWAIPAMIAYGTPLSATQLDATVAGALPGTLVYTPAAGAVLMPGTQMLSVVFTPTDAVDYTTATASVPIVVGGLALTSFAPVGALAGSADTKITLTGTGFVTSSVVLVNGAGVATTYVSPTMLTAVVPAALLKTAGPLTVTVADPSIDATTPGQTFTVLPPTGDATLSGPTTTDPGSQPSVTLSITNPYPLALTAEFSLAFASAGTTQVDDPSIQFSSGGRTYDYTVDANSTTVPPVQLQAGTVAGTITITAKLMADGVDVTPTGLAPLVIVVPAVVPVISSTSITASGNTLTVVIHGFSNTREVSSAKFDFTAATGETLATSTLTIPATTIFGTWYSDATSDAYGSTFTYTQIFNTSNDASTIGSVKVTLTNSVGDSLVSTSTGP